MIPPRPRLTKCLKCKKTFLSCPKSDALDGTERFCPNCKGEKKKLFDFLTVAIFKLK
ncbi:hypothetical protein [Campylobacter sp. 2457A]|uniref:hypothetical protein n=1 Tax=Campylobacter sp. 2457A TaxID=2735784 RepID=UPI00301DF17F|nr:hypothetical protein [Campylobacter sp. 2457A]